MDVTTFFRQRHRDLHDRFLPNLANKLTEEQFRERPIPQLQPIVWLLWHMARVEDKGLSSFLWRKPQLLTQDWQERMQSVLTHYGTSMTEEEVDAFAAKANPYGVLEYLKAVGDRTAQQLPSLDPATLNEEVNEDEVIRIVRDEGMASEQAQWVTPHYVGKTRGWLLCHFGLTHNFRHFGQITLGLKALQV